MVIDLEYLKIGDLIFVEDRKARINKLVLILETAEASDDELGMTEWVNRNVYDQISLECFVIFENLPATYGHGIFKLTTGKVVKTTFVRNITGLWKIN